jgi:predicted glutamine amidotransferase
MELPPFLTLIDPAVEMLSQRGKDAWGMAYGIGGSDLSTVVIKEASRIDLRRNKETISQQLQKIKSSGWLLLHSRLATNGFCGLFGHNHPIEYRGIILAHNGLVVCWPTEVRHSIDQSKTDSQNLAVVIASSPPDELESILNKTTGEISAVWQNNLDNSFNMYTNVGGLYLETNRDYSLVSSEPIYSKSQTKKVELRKIIRL